MSVLVFGFVLAGKDCIHRAMKSLILRSIVLALTLSPLSFAQESEAGKEKEAPAVLERCSLLNLLVFCKTRP